MTPASLSVVAPVWTVSVVTVLPEIEVSLPVDPTVTVPETAADVASSPEVVSEFPVPAVNPVEDTLAVFVLSFTVRPVEASVEPA